jgi:hypothetical protein
MFISESFYVIICIVFTFFQSVFKPFLSHTMVLVPDYHVYREVELFDFAFLSFILFIQVALMAISTF